MTDEGRTRKEAPRTDPDAKPISWRDVTNTLVVHVNGAAYRGANFSGVFEVSRRHAAEMPDADNRILCMAKWHGWSGSDGVHIEVRKGGWRFESEYSGKVVSELGSD